MQELIFALAYDVLPQPVCCRCIRTVHKEEEEINELKNEEMNERNDTE